MSNKIFKRLDPQRDILEKSRIAEEELFFPNKAVAKPFTTAQGYNIAEVPAEQGFESYNSPVFYLEKTNSNITFLSTMRGTSGSLDVASGSGMTYRYMVNLTQEGTQSDYKIKEESPFVDTKEIDVISVSREFYKDGLDVDFFGLAIDITSGSATTIDYGDSIDSGTDGLVGLFPLNEEDAEESPIGKKYYLYRNGSAQEFYNKATDTFTVPDKTTLDTTEAFGEVFMDAGIIVLYIDKLETTYANFTKGANAFNYLGVIGGNSKTRLHSKIYFARLENEEFNYTTNRTFYEDDDETIIKDEFRRNPKTFPTTIGFYNEYDELIAVGKFSTPFEKSPTEEGFVRGELSY